MFFFEHSNGNPTMSNSAFQWLIHHHYLFKSINKINSAMLIQHDVSCPPWIIRSKKDVAICPIR